jgi:hypothetical protein
MSAVAEILAELSRRGVVVRAEGETIRLKPRDSLDDHLMARVRAHKPEILAVLNGRPAGCSPTCYEIEPGKWIHHPWDGCKTCLAPKPEKRPQKTESVCWHCRGTGQCNCISCGRYETNAVWKAGRCVPCEVRMRERIQ